MMKRSVVYVDYDGLGAEGEDRILRSYGCDDDHIALATNLHLVDVSKPLLGQQNPLFGHFCTHGRAQVKGHVLIVIESQDRGYRRR